MVRWNYDEYIKETSQKFDERLSVFYIKRRYAKLSANQKFEQLIDYARRYWATNLDIQSRWAAARLECPAYNERSVSTRHRQRAIYEILKNQFEIVDGYYKKATENGLEPDKLSNDSKYFVKFVQDNLADEKLFQSNFSLTKESQKIKDLSMFEVSFADLLFGEDKAEELTR